MVLPGKLLICSKTTIVIPEKRCEIYSKLTIKTTHVVLVFLLLTLNIFRTFLCFIVDLSFHSKLFTREKCTMTHFSDYKADANN